MKRKLIPFLLLTMVVLGSLGLTEAVSVDAITNGSFETESAWPYPAYGWSGLSFERTSARSTDGTYSLRINDEYGGQVTNYYDLTVDSDNATEASVQIYGDGVASVYLMVTYTDTSSTQTDVSPAPASVWTELNITSFTAGKIIEHILVAVIDPATATSIYIDEITLTYNADATPAPTTTPPTGLSSEFYDEFINFMVPLIVMLVPSVLLGYSFKMDKWGYLIGLAIGSGLGVIFITGFPLWLVFAVFIGLIGFAYSETRRGG